MTIVETFGALTGKEQRPCNGGTSASPTSLSVEFGLTGAPLYSSSSDFARSRGDFVQRRARRTFSTPSCQRSTNPQKFCPPLPSGGLAACCSFLSSSPCMRPHRASSHSTHPTMLVRHHREMILPAPRGFATSSSSIFFQERRSAVVTAGQDVAWKPHILHALTHGVILWNAAAFCAVMSRSLLVKAERRRSCRLITGAPR